MSSYCTVPLLLFQCILLTVTSETRHGSNITCNGNDNCTHFDLLCDPNTNCSITCDGGSAACKNTTILCPINGNCIINCGAYINICQGIYINATRSTSLVLNCNNASNVCNLLTLYCPINGHSESIECRINTINTQYSQIYAVGGFNDIEITGYMINNTKIFCRENYETSCMLTDTPPFECSACQNIVSPSQYLTGIPSNVPTTEPTNDPTIDPTSYPSNNPTEYTINPTQSPSNLPTTEPTNNPTINPTLPEGENYVETETSLYVTTAIDDDMDDEKNDTKKKEIKSIIILFSVLMFMIILIASLFCFISMIKRRQENEKKKDGMEMMLYEAPSLKTNHIETDINEREPGQEIAEKDGFYCRGIMNYINGNEDELNLKKDGIYYIMKTIESGWWFGIDENGLDGWMPSNYLQRLNEYEKKELKQEQKQKTDDGEEYIALLTELMDQRYNDIINNNINIIQENMGKYINMNMPPTIPEVMDMTLVTDDGVSDKSSSSDMDIDNNQTVGNITNKYI